MSTSPSNKNLNVTVVGAGIVGAAIAYSLAEGPDDMAAHIRTILTHDSLNFPIIDGAPGLGVWQGIYLWEHRTHPHTRSIVVTVTS